jgi:hypothetical protein
MSASEPANQEVLTLTNLDAARRQLHTAITLWFTNGDPVSIHTLAAAAYQIVHTSTKKRTPDRRALQLDCPLLTDERRQALNTTLKSFASFFKHAHGDTNGTLHFNPSITEKLIIYSLFWIRTYDTVPNVFESAFMTYLQFHKPPYLSDEGQKFIANNFAVTIVGQIESLSKKDYLELYKAHF